MPADRVLTVVTNSLPIASLLAARPTLTVHLVGGRVRGRTLATVDHAALEYLRTVFVDVAFLGTNGFSLERGLTTPDSAEAAVKAAFVAAARRSVLLADHTKFGSDHFAHFADLAADRHDRHRPSPIRRGRRGDRGGRTPGGARMIVTVTFNPSLDRTMAFQALVRGEVLRADSTLEDPGGKGVNVTRFLTAHGTESIAVLPAGGPMGHALISALDEAGIPHRAIPIAGADPRERGRRRARRDHHQAQRGRTGARGGRARCPGRRGRRAGHGRRLGRGGRKPADRPVHRRRAACGRGRPRRGCAVRPRHQRAGPRRRAGRPAGPHQAQRGGARRDPRSRARSPRPRSSPDATRPAREVPVR